MSSTKESTFTISKVSRSGIVNHQRIEHRGEGGFAVVVPTPQGKKVVSDAYSVQHLMEAVAPDLELRDACPGSPFAAIFSNTNGGGYLSDGYVTDYIDLTDDTVQMEM